MEETNIRSATIDDIPAIALYLNESYATTYKLMSPMSECELTEIADCITAVWHQNKELKASNRAKLDEVQRLRALGCIDDIAVYTALQSRRYGHFPSVLTRYLRKELSIHAKEYGNNQLYERADAQLRCMLLGELCERIVGCHYALNALKKDESNEVFDRYGIPSHMRNTVKNDGAKTQWATADQRKSYPITGNYDYTIFGERFAT